MDEIWDRKSFEVGGHWLLWWGWKKWMTTQNRQKSNAKKKKFNNTDTSHVPVFSSCMYVQCISHKQDLKTNYI